MDRRSTATASSDDLVAADRPAASRVNRNADGLVREDVAAAAVAAAEELPAAMVDPDKLSYEIFSILESKFLFGYDESNNGASSRLPRHLHPPPLPGDASSPAVVRNQRGKVRLLCIDGGGAGGMRGLLPAKALAYLEQALRSKSGDPDARVSDYFDLAAGTGLGGLFSAMLFATREGGRPLFSADETCRFLLDHAKRLFHAPASSSSVGFLRRLGGTTSVAAATAAMERAVKEAFGEGLTLRNTVKPVLIPCYDLRNSAPLVFSRADALESQSFDFRLWEVCRATCAEPGRLEPVEMRSVDGATACVGIDGGLAMSNPAAAAITHVLHNKQEFPFVRGVEDLMVLSLGCGSSANGGGGVAVSFEAERHRLRRWGRKEWARPMARIASDTSSDLVDHAVALAFGQCRSSNYVRIQANSSSTGSFGVDMDCEPSPTNVKIMFEAAGEMLNQKNVESVLFGGRRIGEQTNMEKLDWFAGELVLEHRTRSCRIAPTVAFKQVAQQPTNDCK